MDPIISSPQYPSSPTRLRKKHARASGGGVGGVLPRPQTPRCQAHRQRADRPPLQPAPAELGYQLQARQVLRA